MERIHARRLLIAIILLVLGLSVAFAVLQGGLPF
jgi:hypothetical protein